MPITHIRITALSVKALNTYHSVATAQRMPDKLEVYSQALIKLQQQAVQLTKEYQEEG